MLTMEMVLHKDVDFAPKFGKNQIIDYQNVNFAASESNPRLATITKHHY